MDLNVDRLYEGVVASDELVAKALNVPEMAQIAKSETRLREYLYLKWSTLTVQAVRKATTMARQGKNAKQIIKVVDTIMKKWADMVTPTFKKEFEKSFRLAKLAGYKKATRKTKANLNYDIEHFQPVEKADAFGLDADFVFDLGDQRAMAGLAEHQLFWVGDHYENHTSEAVAANVRDVMAKAGGSPSEAGKLMPKALEKALGSVKTPTGFNGTQAQYYEALAANTMAVARAHGAMRSFMQIGIKRYQIHNPSDERTCERCSHLQGKEFTVEQGGQQMYAELQATTKEEVKVARPWLSATELKKISPQSGFIKDDKARAADSKALAEHGQSLPPFHFRCVLPGSIIQGEVNGASRSIYSGKAFEFTTLKGSRFSVTANHPVFTSRGLISARELCKGDKLISNKFQTGVSLLGSASKGNEYDQPTRVEDIFSAFSKSGVSSFVSTSTDDFHSESASFYGKVDVVGAYRVLLDYWKALSFQDRGEVIFKRTPPLEPFMHGLGAFDFAFKGLYSSPSRFPGSRALLFNYLSIIFTRFASFPFNTFRLGSASDFDIIFDQSSPNSISRAIPFFREFVNRFSGQVFIDQIVNIREFDFCGHVYDLQSPNGWILSQNICISNCRCGVDISSTAETYEDLGPPMIPPTPTKPPLPAKVPLPSIPPTIPPVITPENVGIPTAKNISQAKKIALENDLADAVTYGKGVSTAEANVMNANIYKLKKEWSEAGVDLRKLRLMHPAKRAGGSSAYYTFDNYFLRSDITVNTKLFRNDIRDLAWFKGRVKMCEEVLTKYARNFTKKELAWFKRHLPLYKKAVKTMEKGVKTHHGIHSTYLWKNDDHLQQISAAIHHEYGHAVYHYNMKRVEKFLKVKPNNFKTWKKYAPTQRAMDDFHECMAENFAIYSSGSREGMHKKMVEMFDKLKVGKLK